MGAIPVQGVPWDVAVSPDGRWVFTGDRWGAGLDVIPVGANRVYTTVTGLGRVTGLEVAPDGSRIYASALSDGVHVIHGGTFEHLATVDTPGNAFEAALSCDGSELFVGDTGNTVPVIDAATAAITTQIAMPGYGVRGIAICPQSRLPGLHLYPAADAAYRAAGQTVTFVGHVVNATGQTDSFDLALSGNVWPAQLSATNTGPLSSGGRISFTVQVDVPLAASPGDVDTVTVRATSVTSPTAHVATAELETEVICSPNLVLSGESEIEAFHDDTFNLGEQGLTHIFVHAHTEYERNTMNGALQGYDRTSGVWQTLGTWGGAEPRMLDLHHVPPRYSAVRVDLHDATIGEFVSYDYRFVVCRAPAVGLNPRSEQRLSGSGTTAVYTQTLTNYAMTEQAFDPVSYTHLRAHET